MAASSAVSVLLGSGSSTVTAMEAAVALGSLRALRDALSPESSASGLLLQAASSGYADIVEWLVTSGISAVHEVDAAGCSALHLASACDQDAAVGALLRLGAPLFARDCLERTPLHVAAVGAAPYATRRLLAAGADVLARDDVGRVPIESVAAVHKAATVAGGMPPPPSFLSNLAAVALLLRNSLISEAAKGGAPPVRAAELARASAVADACCAALGAPTPLSDVSASATAANSPPPTPTAVHALLHAARSPPSAAPHGVMPRNALPQRARAAAAAAVAAAGTGDDAAPISGIEDLNILLAILATKFSASVAQGLVPTYAAIYRVLDSAGDGQCSAGDLASGCAEMGIDISPDLLPGVLESMAGREGADTITCAEFVAFCEDAEAALEGGDGEA